MEANPWKLYGHELFIDQIQRLIQAVDDLRRCDPEGYHTHPKAKFLASINRLIRQTIPENSAAPEFRRGKTLGTTNKHWFRAKFHGRYQLFFRFSTQHRIIIYVWLNDDKNLRKAGSKTDPYAVFQSMLKSGQPPQNFEELKDASIALDEMVDQEL